MSMPVGYARKSLFLDQQVILESFLFTKTASVLKLMIPYTNIIMNCILLLRTIRHKNIEKTLHTHAVKENNYLYLFILCVICKYNSFGLDFIKSTGFQRSLEG